MSTMTGTHQVLEQHIRDCSPDNPEYFYPYGSQPGNDLMWSLAESIAANGDKSTVYHLLHFYIRSFHKVPGLVIEMLEGHLIAIEESDNDRA